MGVAKVRLEDGRVEGRRSKVFDYTGKKMLSYGEYMVKVKEEIERVKSINKITINSPWVEGQRLPKGKDSRLWENDSVDCIVRVGVKMAKILKANKITLVKHLVDLPPVSYTHLTLPTKRIV